jgi:hypothetical protein
MSSPGQNPEQMPDAPISKRALLKVLMWACLVLTLPVAMIGAPHKFDEPWGTMLAVLLLAGFLCAVLRCFPYGKSSQTQNAVEPNRSLDPEKWQ